MSNLSKSIVAVCHQLIEKPTNSKVKKNKEYHKALEESKINPDTNQEIVLESRKDLFYVNVKNNICITLYKELSMDQQFTDIDKNILKNLDKSKQVIESEWWLHIAMQSWDIEINFNDTPLSEKISEHKYLSKYGAILKWNDSFIKRSSPWGRDRDCYTLIEATQEDLKEILIWLTGLL